MNEIKLTVEFCTEDRARLDKIIDLLSHQPDCAGCVSSVAETFDRAAKVLNGEKAPKTEDDIAQKCKDTLKRVTEPAKNAQEAPTASDHPTLDPFPETPTATEEQSEAPAEKAKPTVTMDMLRSKAITLAAAGKKDKVREVVHPYAPKVTELPEDVWAEVYKKLCALEG